MNMMTQNSLVDQGKQEKDSTNVILFNGVSGHNNPANSYTGLTLEQMEQRFVFLTQTGNIYDKFTGELFGGFALFKQAYAACTHEIPVTDANGKVTLKAVPTVQLWMKSERRETKRNLTFAPGQPPLIRDGALEFINVWRKIQSHRCVNTALAQPIVDLINALFTDQADDFLDGLAYHWQHPEAQFNHAWLHVSDQTGTGRGRLTRALSATWDGELAVIDDLSPFKSGTGIFSDRIIGKTFYVVEEMAEIAKDKYQAVASLNNAVTKDSLWINPKGEKGYEQLHRAFIFVQSNELDCMPILNKDSRWKVAHYAGNQPFPNEWFKAFNDQCQPDGDMIIAFRQLLNERDVSHYDCGRVRECSAAKRLVIEETKSELQRNVEALISGWKCPYLPTAWVKIILKDMGNGPVVDAALSKTLKEAGCHAMSRPTRITTTTVCRCWVLPGYDNRKGVKEELNALILDVFGAIPVTLTDDQVLQLYCHE